MKWFENCSYYQELKFSQKQGGFVKAVRKFELRLLLRAEIFSKIRQFWWYHLKIWTATIITNWNFCKNISHLTKSFEYLNCPIIMRYNFIKYKAVLMSLENLSFPKISRFWLCHLKNWTVRTISHNVAVLRGRSGPAISKMELFVNSKWLLTMHYFHKELHLRWGMVPRSASGFDEVIWKFLLLLKPAGRI